MVVDKKGVTSQSAVMHLITMAHMGEARGVIEKYNLKRVSQELFKSDELLLLLTGEGPFEAATKTAWILPQFPVTEVINLGIAGSLSEMHKIGDFLKVRTLYLVQGDIPVYKSFQCGDTGIDCLTSFERILDPNKALKLRGFGHLVDREAWGVAMASKTAKLPFSCYKVVSDTAGSLNACELVKERVIEFSEILSDRSQELLGKEVSATDFGPELSGFHFTFSTRHQLKALLQKLSIKENKEVNEILRGLNLDRYLASDLRPKERARMLLEALEHQVDPVKKILSGITSDLNQRFKTEGFELQFDSTWEKESITVSFEASSDEDLRKKGRALEELRATAFFNAMRGKIHVE